MAVHTKPKPGVREERSDQGRVVTIIISRPDSRNAVDGPTAEALLRAFRRFDADDTARVAVLHGEVAKPRAASSSPRRSMGIGLVVL